MTEQSAEEAVGAVIAAALAWYRSGDGKINDVRPALIARIEAAEVRAEKAEIAVLENWLELDGYGHERCRYCGAHVMPGDHTIQTATSLSWRHAVDEQSAEEAVTALLAAAFDSPQGVEDAFSRAVDVMEAKRVVIDRLETAEAHAAFWREQWLLSVDRAEKAETAVLENWLERDGYGHERCRYCGAHVMPGEHEPDCYVAELEARRAN